MGRGRPLQVEWRESEAELNERYRQQKDVQSRQRLHVLWLLRSGKSVRESSRLVGVGERSVVRYLSWYRRGGIAEVLKHRHGGARGRPQAYLSIEQEQALKQAADRGEFKSIWDGVAWVKAQFGISYSYAGMLGLFKRLRLRKKVPRKQHVKSDPTAQEAWKKRGL